MKLQPIKPASTDGKSVGEQEQRAHTILATQPEMGQRVCSATPIDVVWSPKPSPSKLPSGLNVVLEQLLSTHAATTAALELQNRVGWIKDIEHIKDTHIDDPRHALQSINPVDVLRHRAFVQCVLDGRNRSGIPNYRCAVLVLPTRPGLGGRLARRIVEEEAAGKWPMRILRRPQR